jgi:hypothetical protein
MHPRLPPLSFLRPEEETKGKKTLRRLENSFHLFKEVLATIPGSGYMIYRDCIT